LVEYLVSQTLIAPKFRYSQLVKAGPHYYLSGMVGLDNDTGQIVAGGVGPETEKILENLQLLMNEFGLDWQHLAFARVYSSDFECFSEFNAVWEAQFDSLEKAPPARSSIGVDALPLGATVEIEFTFYKEI